MGNRKCPPLALLKVTHQSRDGVVVTDGLGVPIGLCPGSFFSAMDDPDRFNIMKSAITGVFDACGELSLEYEGRLYHQLV